MLVFLSSDIDILLNHSSMRPCIYTFLRFVLNLEITQSGLILRYVTTSTACILCGESTTLTLLPINCRSSSSQKKCYKRRWCRQNQNNYEAEVYQGLSSLDPGKAMRCDGIGPKLLKHCALALYEPFHHLFSFFALHSSGMAYSPHTYHLQIW